MLALSAVLLCAFLIKAVIDWRVRNVDESLKASAERLQSLQDQANAAQAQADQPHYYRLPGELMGALAKPDSFHLERRVANIGSSVRLAFAKAAGESFSMADPNGKWEPTDVIRDPRLPRRRLASVAVGEDLCLLFYEHGGIEKTDNVAVFRISGDHAEPIWHAYVSHDVTTPSALRRALEEKKYLEAPFF